MVNIRKSTKKERIGWYMYDWANSAFSTTVITVFMGPFLTSIASSASINGYIYPFGIKIYADSLFPYVISLSVAFQFLLLPIVGAISDNSNYKKQLLIIFTLIGSLSTMSLYFLTGDNYLFGSFILLIANICFGASMVVYNSYLSQIAEIEYRDKVSSIGWGIGYLGGGLLLFFNLLLFNYAGSIFKNMPNDIAIRISLTSAGVWWLLFSIFPFLWLKNNNISNIQISQKLNVKQSLKKLKLTILDLKNHKNALLFLLAFIFYNDGVQAVIVMSAQFAQREIGLNTDTIIIAILMVQFMAFIGAILFNYISKPIGSKLSILILIVLWCISVIFAYLYLDNAVKFFILAGVIAIGMGGIQALSRSMYSKLIPQDKQGEYFSIYELSEKGSSLLGPLAFAIAMDLTHSYRLGILSLSVFFIIGFILLYNVKYEEVNNEVI